MYCETFKPSNYIQDYTLQLCINIYDFSWLFYRAYYRGLGFCESTELETSGILLNYRLSLAEKYIKSLS